MSSGTGIFLAGLFIGLVMLYGQTKDRWDWVKIAKKFGTYAGIAIFIIIFTIYHASTNWKAFDIDWSLRSFFYASLTVFLIGSIAVFPHLCLQAIYEKILKKNFEIDEDWNERLAYKVSNVLFFAIFWILVSFFFDDFKEFLISSFNRQKS